MLRIPSAGVPITLKDLARGLLARETEPFRCELARLVGARHVGLAGSGAAAFHLALKALAARSERREVVLPAYTAPVVVLPVLKAGLRPVVADVSLDTFNVDPESVARRVTSDTLAVMPAHMFGIPCDMKSVREAAESGGAAVIEDAASALGATLDGRMTGTLGDVGFFSFHRGKQITSVVGGAWVTDDESLAADIEREAAELPRPSAMERAALFAQLAALSLALRPWVYSLFHPLLAGFKDTAPHDDFRLCAYTATQAGAALSLLARLDEIIAARNARAARAREMLADADGVALPQVPPGARPAYNHCPVLLPDRRTRDRALAAALDADVECTALYDRTIYHAYGLGPDECRGADDCPRAEELAARLLLIPCHPLIPMSRVEQAAAIIRATACRPVTGRAPGRRLRVVQVITRLDRGGSSDTVIALCERLDRERFDVTLVAGPAADPIEEPAALARRTDIRAVECPDLGREVRPSADLRALRQLRAILDDIRPDVVHAHTSKAGALGRIAAALSGVPGVYSPHGHLFYGYYGKVGTALVVLAERALAPLGRGRIAALTEASRTEHLDRGIGRFDQFVTVPSGVDLERFARDPAARERTREALGLAVNTFAVGWVGRFVDVKGPDIFVEACSLVAESLAGSVFLMAGDGPLRAAAEAQAEELGVAGRCQFLGRRDDVPALLNACDACVLSSRNEGLGLSVVEALACGTPVIATDVGGVRDALDDGRYGLLVRHENCDSWRSAERKKYMFRRTARAIADAVLSLANDEEKRGRLIQAGLGRAKDFDIDRTVALFTELYEELASECAA